MSDELTIEQQVKQLLRLTSPKELIKSIQTTLHVYLLYQADNGLDMDFKTVVDNQFVLLEFLQELDGVKQTGTTD